MICIIGKIWYEEEIPEDLKTAVIVPLYKKGDTKDPKNYRGISLLTTAYKRYIEVLRERLEEEEEEKDKLLPEGQTGFRRGRSTIDNI